jgi:chemotaxis protein histidine kinase CheA
MGVKKIKISALPLADTLVGLYTIGVNALNKSVKVSLEFLKTAADKANDAATAANKAKTAAETATEAAKTATKNANTATEAANTAAKNATDKATAADTAAKNANIKADAADKAAGAATTAANTANSKAALADQKATAADNAANLAGETAEEARATIVRLEELEESLVGQYKMIPTGMNLDYPPRITFRNTVPRRITYELLPTNTGRNVLFLGDDNAVSVQPDGSLTVNRTGISKIHVIPTENTSIYRTIQITVAEPELRRVKSNSLRLMGNGSFRLT